MGGKIAADVQQVTAEVETVQVAVGLAAKDPSQGNVDQLAQVAQTAHDQIAAVRDRIASDSSGDVGTALFGGADELKNAMGAAVAYTGGPNPASLAHFSGQYQSGVADWNAAVVRLYRGRAGTPPTIPTS